MTWMRCDVEINSKYDEIMSRPHHISNTRPQMPMSDRAARFAHFAALNMKPGLLMDCFDDVSEVSITCFQPDEGKVGGAYLYFTGRMKKSDGFKGEITMRNGMRIRLQDVPDIEGDVFSTPALSASSAFLRASAASARES